MRRRMERKWISVLLVFCMLVSVIVVMPVVTWAGELPASVTLVAYPEHDYQFFERVSTKASQFKTSDKSIVSVKQKKTYDEYCGKCYYYLYLKAQNPGTATVSVKLKDKTYKTKVTVKKYVNPVQSVKIGGTSVSGSRFNSASIVNLSYGKFASKKVKTTVVLKNGWKLDEYYYWDSKQQKGFMLPGFEYFPKGEQEGRIVINGHKVPVKGGKGFEILISAINEKSGMTEYVSLMFR